MNPSDFIICENVYGKHCVPVSSSYTFTSTAILNGQVHEPQTIEFIMSNCIDGGIIHAGAGFGDFLPGLSRACKSTVWSFEPNKENYFCAKKTIELNQLMNVKLTDCGLGQESKGVYLRVEEDSKKLGPRCEIYNENLAVPNHELEFIKIISLDDFIPLDEQISIIHLDVEGYEHEVLKGASRIIENNHPTIILEIHAEPLKYNKFMEKIGYYPVKQLIYDAGQMVFVNTVYKHI